MNWRKIGSVLLLIVLIVFAVQGLRVVSTYVGYATFAGSAGNIYELVIAHHLSVTEWSGQYGVTVRVDGFTFPQNRTFTGGQIVNNNLLFDCLQPDAAHEVYASTYPTDELDLNSISPATAAEVDSFFSLNASGLTSADRTFSSNISFNFGSLTITAPGAYTYKINEVGTPSTFGMVALKDGNGKLFFGALITNFTEGFDGQVINYQLLLPIFGNQSQTNYYFFTDPNDRCPAGYRS
jgi:hypothetical protein